MKRIYKWLWQAPQNIVGFLVMLFTHARKVGDWYEFNINCGSVSLGKYVFLCPSHWDDEQTLLHEFGHQKQSEMLGWLYLPIIAIPSLIWCGCFEWYRKKHNVSYYDFYTEKWADQIAGINRKKE